MAFQPQEPILLEDLMSFLVAPLKTPVFKGNGNNLLVL